MITLFSTEADANRWRSDNCNRCRKGYCNISRQWGCDIEHAIDAARSQRTGVSHEIASRAGYDPAVAMWSCPEIELKK